MAIVLMPFEGSGNVVAGAVSGFQNVTVGAGGTLTYVTANSFQGTASVRAVPASGQACFGQVGTVPVPLNSSKIAISAMFNFEAVPAQDQWIMPIFDTTGATICKVLLASDGKLKLQLSTTTVVWAAAATVTLNAWRRVELWIDRGASAGAGSYTVAYFIADSATPIETFSVTGTAALGSVNVGQFRLGKSNASTGTAPIRFDATKYDTAATALIGPYPTSALLVVSITDPTPSAAMQNETVVLRGDAPGATSLAWSIPAYPATMSGPPVITNPTSGTTASFVAVAPGEYTVRLTAIDSSSVPYYEERTITVTEATAPAAGPRRWDGTVWER